VQVPQRLCVLCEAQDEVSGLEGSVSEILNLCCDFQNLFAFPFLVPGFLVFGVVFVGVAGDVFDFLCCLVVVLARELAAVCAFLCVSLGLMEEGKGKMETDTYQQ
jgi:hypothetical protein